jgi:hypothetical protein
MASLSPGHKVNQHVGVRVFEQGQEAGERFNSNTRRGLSGADTVHAVYADVTESTDRENGGKSQNLEHTAGAV